MSALPATIAIPAMLENVILCGDALDMLRSLPDNSVDAIVTDPPAGIAFMGKHWDSDKGGRDAWIAWLAEIMREAWRVTKPGGHALVWALPRTSHWTAMALEDAGFEVREKCFHIFGSGFPKSRRVNMDERYCHCDASEHTNSRTSLVQAQDDHTRTVLPSEPVANAVRNVLNGSHATPDSLADCQRGCDSDDALLRQGLTGDQESAPSREYAQAHTRYGERVGDRVAVPSHILSPAQRSDRPANRGSARRAKSAASTSGDIQENTTASASTPIQMDNALSATHTQYMASQSSASAAPFLSNCTTCGKPIANGLGTALKPAVEEWILCRKPLSEKNVAANVLRWGTGALNIGASRVGSDPVEVGRFGRGECDSASFGRSLHPTAQRTTQAGRFPANLLLSHAPDCDDGGCSLWCPVRELDAQSGIRKSGGYPAAGGQRSRIATYGTPNVRGEQRFTSSEGGASRYFQVFAPFTYQSKASRAERNRGCSSLEAKANRINAPRACEGENFSPSHNHHPTVKSLALMSWLITLITPPGGLVLDPFAGSGSTLVAAKEGGWRYLGIEREAEYVAIAQARLEAAPSTPPASAAKPKRARKPKKKAPQLHLLEVSA